MGEYFARKPLRRCRKTRCFVFCCRFGGAALAGALFLVLLAAGPAQACCVYNNATYPMETQSNIDGMHDWIVHPSNHRCTRGTGDKHVDFWMRGPFERAVISTQGRLWMAKHGWLTLSKKQDGKWKAQSYNPDGSVHSTTYIEERNDQPKKP